MSKQNWIIKDIIVVGFATFAIFFGAGNLIFPPALGLMSGDQWPAAFLGFVLMDVGLSALGIFVMLEYGGKIQNLASHLGKKMSLIISVAVVCCMGPFVAIPRTGTVAYSLGIKPLTGLFGDHPQALFLFSILFFAITFLLAIKPGKVVDIIGQYLTPILLVCLIIMIIIGMIFGHDVSASKLVDNTVAEGISNGYQTMDTLGGVIFSGIIMKAAFSKPEYTESQSKKIVYGSTILACLLLCLIYGGLTYMGKVWGQSFTEYYVDGTIDQAGFTTIIVYEILGKWGVYVIAIVSVFACLTTSIGLTSASAEFFTDLLPDKISYEILCAIICILGALLCNIGLAQIQAVSMPILNVLYPVIIVLLIVGFFHKKIHGHLPYILGTCSAFLVSLFTVLCDKAGFEIFHFVHALPLNVYGLNFVVPSLITVAAGILIEKMIQKNI